ncbi:MAG: amidohydrolase family protein [Myxococcota bacterium]
MAERRIIRGARLLPLDGRRQLRRADVLIEGGKIAAIGGVKDAPDAELIETTAALIPGLVQAHLHLDEVILDRKFVAHSDPLFHYEVELVRWLERQDEAALLVQAYSGIGRGLLAGATAFADVGRSQHRVVAADVAAELGARLLAPLDGAAEDLERAIDRLVERYDSGGLVRPGIWLHDAESVAPAALSRAGKLSEARGIPLFVHVGRLPGVRGGVDRLRQHGALHRHTVICHGRAQSLRGYARALVDAGATVVLTPGADLMVGASPPALEPLLSAGVELAIGGDGGSSRTEVDPFRDARLLYGLLRGRADHPASRALEIASRGGARALGVGSGSLEVGQPADLVFVDVAHVDSDDHEALARRILDHGGPEQVRAVWVAGTRVAMDGRLERGSLPTMEEEDEVRARILPRLSAPLPFKLRAKLGLRRAVAVDRGWGLFRLPFKEER